MFNIDNNKLVNKNSITNTILNTVPSTVLDKTSFSKRFTSKDPLKEYFRNMGYQCPICIIISRTGKSKRYSELLGLRLHVERVHKGYCDPKTSLTYTQVLDFIKLADPIVFLRIVS